jgi:predicted AAA+ superfamily ATPase
MSYANKPYQRAMVNTILARMREPRHLIQVVAGPRQTGKSTALQQAISQQDLPFRMVSTDAVFAQPGSWLETQWDAARHLIDSEHPSALLVIDEVQAIPQWSSYVKKLWDEDARRALDLRVVLSGSSSLLLQKGLSESLMGRFEVLYSNQWSYREMRDAFDYSLDDFLIFGGYPGAAPLRKDFSRWNDYMRDAIIEATLSKDVLQMQDIRKPALLRRLFILGSSYSAKELSYRKMLGQLDDKGNTDTMATYLELLSKAGLLTGLEKFDSRGLIRLRRTSPRLMVHDTSLMTASLSTSKADAQMLLHTPDLRGYVVESAIGAYLLGRCQEARFDVFWWRDGDDEVDFVLKQGERVTAIEVKSGRNKKAEGFYRFCRLNPGVKPLLVGDENCTLLDFLSGNVSLF